MFTWSHLYALTPPCELAIQGGSLEDARQKLKTDFWPTFLAELLVWPAVQGANFRYVPVHHQLLVVNLLTIFDSGFMSWSRASDGWWHGLLPDGHFLLPEGASGQQKDKV